MNDLHSASSGPGPEEAGRPRPGRGDSDRRLAELLARSSRGDQRAFTELYDATAARLHGLVLRVVRDRAQAEEVTQETYLQIWRESSRFDPDRAGSPMSWLMTLAHRRAVDRVRNAEASSRYESKFHRLSPAASHDTTSEQAAASWEARRLRAALATLTPIQREAVELVYLGGYTHVEVAGLLDLPVGTAKTRIRDGMIRLRDTMGVSR